MPYKFITDIATADAAFEAWGESMEELFISSSEALINLMVENPLVITAAVSKTFTIEEETPELLLYALLDELIFLKDAEQLLTRVEKAETYEADGKVRCTISLFGELINPERHHLTVDVKAVTLHQFKVERTESGWTARVIVDI